MKMDYLTGLLIVIIVVEGVLILRKNLLLRSMIDYIKTEKLSKRLPQEFINAYKSKIKFMEQHYIEKIGALENEKNKLKNDFEEKVEVISKNNMDLYKKLNTLFHSISELIEAFKLVLDEVNERLVKNLNDINRQSTEVIKDIEMRREEVDNSIENINQLLDKTHGVYQNIYNLLSYVEDIGQITQFINDIVKEISFISLNAQIEASKIRKDSIVFSLLASELRKLAENGKGALKNIDNTVSRIVSDITSNSQEIDSFITDIKTDIKNLKEKTQLIIKQFEFIQKFVYSVLEYQNQFSDQIKQHFAGIQETVGILENVYNEGIQLIEKHRVEE